MGGAKLYRSLQQRGTGRLNIKDYCYLRKSRHLKLRYLAFFCVGEGGFPGSSAGKESVCNAGDPSLIPGFGKIPWRRAWRPTAGFFPGEGPRTKGLVGCSPWGHKESDTTEMTKRMYGKMQASGGSLKSFFHMHLSSRGPVFSHPREWLQSDGYKISRDSSPS